MIEISNYAHQMEQSCISYPSSCRKVWFGLFGATFFRGIGHGVRPHRG